MRIDISRHAIIRYWERVRPTLPDIDAAADDLERLVREHGHFTDEKPYWLNTPRTHEDGVMNVNGFMMIGDDVCLLIANRTIVTCIPRGEVSKERRDKRRTKRRAKRHQRRMASMHDGYTFDNERNARRGIA